MRIAPNSKCQRVLVLALVLSINRKNRGDKFQVPTQIIRIQRTWTAKFSSLLTRSPSVVDRKTTLAAVWRLLNVRLKVLRTRGGTGCLSCRHRHSMTTHRHMASSDGIRMATTNDDITAPNATSRRHSFILPLSAWLPRSTQPSAVREMVK